VRFEKITDIFKPDLLFVIKGERLKPSTIKLFKCKRFLWNNDDFQFFNLALAKEFDYVGTPVEDFIPKYEEIGVKAFWINYPYAPEVHRPLNLPKKHDLIFIGTFYPERAYLIEQLNLLGNKVLIYGNGWERIGINTPRVTAERMVELYNESKIVLNMHQKAMAMHKVKANLRIYEALGCGAFILTDYCPGMEEIFQDGEHLVVYKDTWDLNWKIKYYLKNEEERKEIAKKGHDKVKEYSIDRTLERIFKEIGL
jgi:spore maturation protein CgeB